MWRTARVLAAALGVVMLVTGIALWFRADHPFDVQGHRGARGLLPENTMPAFTYADDLGVTTLEMDTKVTRDGVLVVTHDSTLNPDLVRDSSGRWVAEGIPVNSLTLAQIKELDVGRLRPGTAYAERLPEQQPIDGTRIPTLREVLDTFRDRSDVRLSIETIRIGRPHRANSPASSSTKCVPPVSKSGA